MTQKWRIISDQEAHYYLVPAHIKHDELEAWEEWCEADDESRGEWLGFDFLEHEITDELENIVFEAPQTECWIGGPFDHEAIPESHPCFSTPLGGKSEMFVRISIHGY